MARTPEQASPLAPALVAVFYAVMAIVRLATAGWSAGVGLLALVVGLLAAVAVKRHHGSSRERS